MIIFGVTIGIYLLWTLATYLLEGRIELMHNPTPLTRSIYVLLANGLLGIGAAMAAFHLWFRNQLINPARLGFRGLRRTLIASLLALLSGGGLFLLQGAPTLNPLVLLNGFTLVLPVSIAEVIVCWALIGGSFEKWGQSKGKIAGIISGIVASDLLFGVYHFAHSAPFNQWEMVLFLMIPGLLTSLVFFLGRDIYATIIFHNFMGMTGVMQNADLDRFNQPIVYLYLLLALMVAELLIADRVIIRK